MYDVRFLAGSPSWAACTNGLSDKSRGCSYSNSIGASLLRGARNGVDGPAVAPPGGAGNRRILMVFLVPGAMSCHA